MTILEKLGCLLLMLAFIWPAVAQENKSLSQSAERYGFLMTDHWLIQDLSRQIDRALFYKPDPAANETFHQLRAAIALTERKLDDARILFKQLYRTNSPADLPRLTKLLDEAAALDSSGNRDTEWLLQQIGQRMTRGKFVALPISEADLNSKWANVIAKDFKPKRILFGSTATPGETRVAPLKFDFCKGLFGFYAPMSGPGELVMSESLRNRIDAAYSWMRANQVGYHYWAGIYNNQNTYVAPWFLKAHGNDPDIWMKLADGKTLKGGGDWGQLNIWNANVEDYIRNYCEAQSRALHDDPFLLCYDYTAEPHPWAGQGPEPAGLPQYSGYNESAIHAFRQYLRKKFGTIEKLNKSWNSTYASFDSIPPGPDPYVHLPEKLSPLSYEFERFRCDSHTRFWRMAYEAYRKFDKTKPIVANASMYMSGWPVEALDAYQMQKETVADWIDMHMNNFPPNLPEQIYLYSLCRLTGKVPVQFEYIWTFPRTGTFDDNSESDFRATCEASVWRNLVWGKKAFVFFDVAYDWPAYHNAFLDREVGYSILRPSICVVPTVKRKALRFNDFFLNTEVVSPPIIILQPTISVLNSPPIHPNRGFNFHTPIASDLHKLLFSKNYPFLYVSEEAVLEDGYSLKQHKVVLLPQAASLPDALTDRLLAWVKAGGTLVSVGIPGVWNPYGQDDLRLITAIFGPSEIKDEKPGQWRWSWKLEQPPSSVEVVNDESGKVLAARATYGRGKALVSTRAYSSAELRKEFYQMIDAAIGQRPAYCAHDTFELVLRQDKQNHRYLFALNPDTRETRTDKIILTGTYPQCIDLGIGSGVPIPLSLQAKETHFHLRLHPGEGTMIALQSSTPGAPISHR